MWVGGTICFGDLRTYSAGVDITAFLEGLEESRGIEQRQLRGRMAYVMGKI